MWLLVDCIFFPLTSAQLVADFNSLFCIDFILKYMGKGTKHISLKIMLKKKIILSGVRLSLQNQGQALEKIPRSSRFGQSPTRSSTLRVMSIQAWWVDFWLASPCWQQECRGSSSWCWLLCSCPLSCYVFANQSLRQTIRSRSGLTVFVGHIMREQGNSSMEDLYHAHIWPALCMAWALSYTSA